VSVPGRLLAVDYGHVRIGLAVSDPDRNIASPLASYNRKGSKADATYFAELAKREEIKEIILGLPLRGDAREEGQKAQEVRRFGAWLTDATGLPVICWDEGFTTVQAEAHLWSAGLTHKARKARRDQIAAQIILQSYLDAGCPGQNTYPA
jgi:putative holliday junction resolvase